MRRSMSRKRREKIYKRDGHTCRNPICIWRHSKFTKDRLEIHHIIPFCECPELDADDANLISLCYDCHKELTNGASVSLDRYLNVVSIAENRYFEIENKFPPKKMVNKTLKMCVEYKESNDLDQFMATAVQVQ